MGLIVEGVLFASVPSWAFGIASFLPSSKVGDGNDSVAFRTDLARDFFKVSRESVGLGGMLDSFNILPLQLC